MNIRVMLILVLSTAGRTWGDEASNFASGAPEEEAYQAAKAMRPLDPLEQVRGMVTRFMDSYPDTKWRREAKLRFLKCAAFNASARDVVEACMEMTMAMPGSYLGDMATRDGWAEVASLLSKSGRHEDAGRLRLLVFIAFPYQLENSSSLFAAMKEFAQADRHREALGVARLALAFVQEADCKEVVGLARQSLKVVAGEAAAVKFEEHWRQEAITTGAAGGASGANGNPLEGYEVPEEERLIGSAKAALAGEGLLSTEPVTRGMQRGLLFLLTRDLAAAAMEYQSAVAASAPDRRDAAAYQAGAYFRFLDGSSVRASRYGEYVKRAKAGPEQPASAGDGPSNPFVDSVSLRSY